MNCVILNFVIHACLYESNIKKLNKMSLSEILNSESSEQVFSLVLDPYYEEPDVYVAAISRSMEKLGQLKSKINRKTTMWKGYHYETINVYGTSKDAKGINNVNNKLYFVKTLDQEKHQVSLVYLPPHSGLSEASVSSLYKIEPVKFDTFYKNGI